MNMDQVMVLVYSDRNHKSRVIHEGEFYEMFVCENNFSRCLNDEEDFLEAFAGDFNYISFNQAVINGDTDDYEECSRVLNAHWSSRREPGRISGVYGFVNAGSLDHRLFSDDVFESKAPTDFKIWLYERRAAHAIMNDQKIAKLKADLAPEAVPKPKVVNERKAWIL